MDEAMPRPVAVTRSKRAHKKLPAAQQQTVSSFLLVTVHGPFAPRLHSSARGHSPHRGPLAMQVSRPNWTMR